MPDWPATTAPSSLTFADLLRHHRTAAGLTQEGLAARAGLSVDAVSTLERGARRRPRKDTVALLAEALDLSDEGRAAFAAAARKAHAAALAATPPTDGAGGLNGHISASFSDTALPHGVVTFLIADLEDSTSLLHRLDDRYAEVLADVQTLLHTIWAAHAGHELGTQGDRFFAVFASAEDALAAAGAAQQALAAHSWAEGAPVRVRIGLHSGAALLTAGRYVGLEVHRAACIAAAGHGGQVLVSRALVDQVTTFGGELSQGTRLRSLGKHRLQDLPHREELYQLAVPGLPAAYPPLRTLDAWPGLRADLTAVALISMVLLAIVGLLLPLVVRAVAWIIGLAPALLAVLVLLCTALLRPVRRALQAQWRDARKPLAAVMSSLLSLVVVVTTLFVTKPPVVITAAPNPFIYTYHTPTQTGGSVTLGVWCAIPTLAPGRLGTPSGPCQGSYAGLWQACVVQLPDLSLRLAGWKADQCTDVPTVVNHGESVDEKTTIFHIDPHATWSDGTPLIADDFLFAYKLFADPTINTFGTTPFNLMQLTAPDPHTVQIQWSVPYADYLVALEEFTPLPLHVYATGAFAGVYDPRTDAYNPELARRLVESPEFNTTVPVDNGPFTVQSFPPSPSTQAGAGPAVLVRNPRFFSNFFHQPSLDRVTLVSPLSDFASNGQSPSKRQLQDDLVAQYRRGQLTVVGALTPLDMLRLGDIPKAEVLTSPLDQFIEYGFNQRDTAPNAQANRGHTMFADPSVRQAFEEAFDRCAAMRKLLHIANCNDHNLYSDELTTPPATDYDPTFKLPAYNPTDAAKLLDRAGYPVVDGVRRGRDGKTPLQLRLILSFSAADSADLARSMQQDYARNLHVSVTITVPTPTPFASYDQGGAAATGAFDLLLFANGGYGPDPVGAFAGNDAADIPSAQNPNGQNFFGIVDPHLGQQDRVGSEVLDPDQRAGVYRALQRYFAQQFYFVPVYILANVVLKKPTLCNFTPYGFTWNIADWYVAPSCPS